MRALREDGTLRAAGLLILLIALVWIPGAAGRDWWYPDEPDVALPMVEMHARGDWVVPTHNGAPWLDYPPLAYWSGLTVASATGGISPWTTRVPMAGFLMVLVLATIALARRWSGPRCAWAAGGILVATPVLWFHGAMLQVDLGFAAAIAAGMACYLHADGHRRALAWRAAAFAAFGVAWLAKGPLGVLLPGLILVCWHGANREWRPLLALAPLSLVSVVVVAPWYVLLVDRIGIETVVREVWAQNFDRFGNTARGHGNKGLIYYPSRLAADFLPWVLLLGPALWALGREWRNDRTARLLLIWILVPLVFFTIASTKRNVYLVPLYPALAAVVAWWLLRCGPGGWQALVERGLRPVMAIAGAGLVAAAAMAPWLPAPEAVPVELITALRPGLVVVGLTLLAGALWPRGPATDPVGRWRWIGGTMVAGWAGALWLVIPAFDPMRSYRPAALDIVGMVPPGEAVGFFAPGWEKTKRPAWLCHLDGRRLAIHGSTTAALAWLRSDPGRVMLTRPRHVPGDLPAVVVERTWRISSDGWALVRSATSATAP